MEDLYDPEEKILCPYNSSHHIRKCKMPFHLVKCKKNYPDQRMVSCDFNATHVLPEPELRYHHQICPDRKKIEAQICGVKSSARQFKIPNLSVECDENWDDLNVPSYDPSKYVENNDVLRQLNVASKAKKRNFRLNERQRLNSLMNNRSQPELKEESVKLPPHRAVTEVTKQNFNPALFKERFGKETK